MTTITVYLKDEEVFQSKIYQEFLVIESPTGELFWHETENTKRPGVVKIWLQAVSFAPRLLFVLPEWQLIIGGIWMEKKFYQDIENLKGKEVELRYKEYRFVFQFD